MTRMITHAAMWTAMCVLITAAGVTSRAAESASAPIPATNAVAVDVFKAPTIKNWAGAQYPESERSQGNEGWVRLSMMIDPEGKPYEISVVDSLGGAAFEKIAIAAAKRSTFLPATQDGKPVHSGYEMKTRFAINMLEKAADPTFISTYGKLVKAVQEGKKDSADLLLPRLQASNLYEDAYRNFALYQYYVKWGSEEQRLEALNGALAGEGTDRYLGRQAFLTAMEAKLVIDLKTHRFGDALSSWAVLSKTAPAEQLKLLQPAMAAVAALQNTHDPVRTSGEIIKGTSWFTSLFRRQFEVVVQSGAVSEIKLRCEKSYVFFLYQAGVRYDVAEAAGRCSMQIIGDPGTKFELVQT